MPIARQPRSTVAPVPRPAGLADYVGMWVAVKDDAVIAAERTSRELAFALHKMDDRLTRDAVMEFVLPATASYVVGVG